MPQLLTTPPGLSTIQTKKLDCHSPTSWAASTAQTLPVNHKKRSSDIHVCMLSWPTEQVRPSPTHYPSPPCPDCTCGTNKSKGIFTKSTYKAHQNMKMESIGIPIGTSENTKQHWQLPLDSPVRKESEIFVSTTHKQRFLLLAAGGRLKTQLKLFKHSTIHTEVWLSIFRGVAGPGFYLAPGSSGGRPQDRMIKGHRNPHPHTATPPPQCSRIEHWCQDLSVKNTVCYKNKAPLQPTNVFFLLAKSK